MQYSGDNKWYSGTIIMKSKKRVKVTYEGWDPSFSEWVKKTTSRVSPVGTFVEGESRVPSFARPRDGKDDTTGIGVGDSAGFRAARQAAEQKSAEQAAKPKRSRKTSYVRRRIADLEEAEQARALNWQHCATSILEYKDGDVFRPMDNGVPAAELDVSEPQPAESDGDGNGDAEASEEEAEEARRPTLEDLKVAVEQAKMVKAHLGEETKLMTLLDEAEEWVVVAKQMPLSGKTSRKRSRPRLEDVEALVAKSKSIPLKLDGVALMHSALSEARQWMDEVAGALRVDSTPKETLDELASAADDLRVELSNADELKQDLRLKQQAQALDKKIAAALAEPAELEDLEELRDQGLSVRSRSTLFERLKAKVEAGLRWQKATDTACDGSKLLSLVELSKLVMEGEALAADAVLVSKVDELKQHIEDGERWVAHSNATLDWTKVDLQELRSLGKMAVHVRASMPELDKITSAIDDVNEWLTNFRKLVPKRVNKKSTESLHELAELEALLVDGEKITIAMDEKVQLATIVEEARVVISEVQAALAREQRTEDEVKDCSDSIKAWKELLKKAEGTPVLIKETEALAAHIKVATATLTWKLKAQDTLNGDAIPEAKLEQLIQDARRTLQPDAAPPEELVELERMRTDVLRWLNEVDEALDSKGPDRIATLERLMVETEGDEPLIDIDLSGNDLMDRLKDSLKTYCICGVRVSLPLLSSAWRRCDRQLSCTAGMQAAKTTTPS
jgi:hypothetical protein